MYSGVVEIFGGGLTQVSSYLSSDVGTVITFVIGISLLLLVIGIVFKVLSKIGG